MKEKFKQLENLIDNLYDTAHSVMEKQEQDQQSLMAVMIERDIYKTAFKQIKQSVGNIKLENLSESNQSAEYNIGKINAYLSIINEIKVIEEINGLIPVKPSNKGDLIIWH